MNRKRFVERDNQIYNDYKSGITKAELAKKHGVSYTAIFNVIRTKEKNLQMKGGQEKNMGLFNKQPKPTETYIEAPSTNVDDNLLDDEFIDGPEQVEQPEPMQQQIKQVVRNVQPQQVQRPVQRPIQKPIQQPTPTVIEREITLSLLNDKLNFIISKIQEEE